MRKPQSIPTDQNRRRLVTESFTVEWAVGSQRHRMTIEPWGQSYEPSVPKLHPVLNAFMLAVVLPMAVYWGSWIEVVCWAAFVPWAALMAPAALMGVLAPREALSPVSAAHDYMYLNNGHVEYEALHRGEWHPADYMTRKQADAVMLGDSDDPLWLRYAAYVYVRLVGWWPWHRWDEWLHDTLSSD